MKKILVVEDELILGKLFKMLLNEFEVTVVDNVALGLSKSTTIDYDLVITDLVMAPLDGFYFLEKNNLKCPIFVISALEDKDSIVKAYILGANDYICKPIDEDILKLKVDNLLLVDEESDDLVSLNENDYSIKIKDDIIVFSITEYELFTLLFKNKYKLYSREKIIEYIWFDNSLMSDKIVYVNIFNIRKKLGKYSYLIKTVRHKGIMYDDKK